MKQDYIMERYFTKIKLFSVGLLSLLASIQLMAQDLGPSAYSKLTWDHISTVHYASFEVSATIGLTTDKKMYVWGNNVGWTIHTNYTNATATIFYPLQQVAPFYVPSPAGETIKKVQVKSTSSTVQHAPTYFCLSESGKLYAWGFNNGLLATAWPVPTGSPSSIRADSARTTRTPVQLTILGETNFVDFDVATYGNYWIAIGASGKAYHIGNVDGNGTLNVSYNYAAIPNPAGVDNATFKYTNVWVFKERLDAPTLYLKGNNGKVYFTGTHHNASNTGVPSLFWRNTPAPTITNDGLYGRVRILNPLEVPFPTGVDIVNMEIGYSNEERQTTYALSADGKAYMTGFWRKKSPAQYYVYSYVVVPLKSNPLSTELDVHVLSDTLYVLKSFVEIAMPPGATKILDIMSHERYGGVAYHGSSVVGDNNKVYWSGVINPASPNNIVYASNYLTLTNNDFNAINSNDKCIAVDLTALTSPFTWTEESINLEGAAQLFITGSITVGGANQMGVISKTGRGYFLGELHANAAPGKTASSSSFKFGSSAYPLPIANEQLLSCQSSPGDGGNWSSGPVTPTNTAVGTIDCSKTKLYPAPVAGVPSQVSLIVTVNVTTIGDFTPITVSGSGMSLPSGFSSVTATTTGVQTFHIPLNYDGTALTNAFQFTVGSAGSCSADLTQKSNPVITNVWNLTNCSAITPGVLSK